MTPSADAGAGGSLNAGASVPSGEPPGPSDDIMVDPLDLTMTMSSDESSTMELCGNGHNIAFLKLQDSGSVADPATDFAVKNFSGSSCDGRSNRSNSNSSANTSTQTTDLNADPKIDKNVHWQSLPMIASDADGRPNNMSQALEPLAAAPWSEIFYDNPLNIASERHSSPPQSSRSRHSPLMPFAEALLAEKKEQSMRRTQACHKKTKSQLSTTSSVVGRKRGPSCDPSPRSQLVGDGSISPADAFDTSSPDCLPRWPQVGGVTDWAQFLNVQYPPEPDFLPTSINPADLAPATRPARLPQQMSVSGSPPAKQVAVRHDLYLVPTPPKSRVETQIPIKMVLSSLPMGVTKLRLPKHTISKPKLMARPPPEPCPDTLELFVSLVCTSAMEQPALMRKAFERAAKTPQGHLPDPDDEENSPQRGGEVRICAGCITRERKRAARKKVKKPDEDRLWSQNEERRVVVFNTHEIKEWYPLNNGPDANGQSGLAGSSSAMQIDAPMRIACYCRHHNEKVGFNVIFTIKDWKETVIAQAMSTQIMITDDHKTNPVAQQVSTQPPVSSDSTDVSAPVSMFQFHPMQMDLTGALPLASSAAFGFSSPTTMMTSSSDHAAAFNSSGSGTASPAMVSVMGSVWPLSRPPSPGQIGGHPAKKRKSSSPKVPSELVMTQLDANPSPASRGAVSVQASDATSPFASHPSPFFQGDPLFAQEQLLRQEQGQQLQQQQFQQQQQQQQQHQHQQQQHQQQQQQQQQQQRSPSQHPHHQLHNSHQMAFVNSPALQANAEMPLFRDRRSESVDNVAFMRFCSAPASSQHSRAPSPNSLRNGVGNVSQIQLAQNVGGSMFPMAVPMSSPRALPIIHKIIPNEGPMLGGIEVTVLGESFFQGVEVSFGTVKATTTTYWGPTSLVCLLPPSAVAGLVPVTFGRPSIAAQSFAGKQPPMFKYIDDTEDKIIRTALSVLGHKMSGQLMDAGDLARRILNETTPAWTGGSPAGPSTGGPSFNQASSSSRSHLECQLLNLLDLIDMGDGAHRTRLDMKGPTGHTMLHLACVLGYHRFVAALLARGANANARDRGGFTPLHMAALHNHPEIVKRLVNASANAKIRSLSGLTARDVSPSRAVYRSMRSAKHIRSRSGGSVQSRNGSEASAHSMARNHTLEGPLSGFSREESPEYSSGDFEDEDPDENSHLKMRRPSRGQDRGDSDGATEKEEEDDDDDGSGSGSEDSSSGMASNTAAMAAAIKEQIQTQFQQLQQTMALHLQNLANLPQVGMPQMPQMPIFSGMPMLPDYQAYLPQADFMRRMQQLVPGMSGNRGDDAPSPPPSYEEIFPREGMDKKMESAARAAVDAEADLKCSAVYDGASSLKRATTGSQTEARTQIPAIPAVLEIGRKNAITKQQQDNFLRAREQKLKRLSNDPNLFLIWIPLLFIMICGLLYNCFPLLFPFVLTSVRAMVQKGVAWSVKSIETMADRVVQI